MATKRKTGATGKSDNVEPIASAAATEQSSAATDASQAAETLAPESETGGDASQSAADQPAAEGRVSGDAAHLRQMATWHGAAAIAALTLFGAAHTWAAATGLPLAVGNSVAAAFLAGMVLSPLFHEWGHFAGARLSGAVSPVLEKPYRLFFMFRFDMQANDTRQALWRSWGGQVGSGLLAVAILLLVPMDSFASAMLLATAVGVAFNASLFEIPVILRTRAGADFETELNTRLKTVGVRQMPGLVVGLITLAALT